MPFGCKEAKRAYDKAYYWANREKALASNKTYYKANREKALARSKVYYEANKKKTNAYQKSYYAANKEKINEQVRAWGKANREMKNASEAKRRALKIKQIPTQVRDCPIEKKRLYHTYKLCALFTKATGVKHHVDHMWPLSDGGPHWSGNLQIITATENMSKNDKVDPNIKATIQDMLKDIKDAY